MAAFAECWGARTGEAFRAPFVFPPPALLLVAPMVPAGAVWAAACLDAMSAVALLVMAVALWRIASAATTGWRRLTAAVWVALACSSGGVAASMFLGQLGLMAGLAVALLALHARRDSSPALAVGTVLAAMKPHLALAPLLFAWLIRPRAALAGKAAATAVILVSLLLSLALDGEFLADYAASLDAHAGSRFSRLDRPEVLYGAPGLLRRAAAGDWVVLPVAVALVAGLLAGVVSRGVTAMDRPVLLIAALTIAGAMSVPHKDYDFAVYAVAFAAGARAPIATQIVLAPAMLLVWRPNLAGLALDAPPDRTALVDGALVFVAGTLAGLWIAARARAACAGRDGPAAPYSPEPARTMETR